MRGTKMELTKEQLEVRIDILYIQFRVTQEKSAIHQDIKTMIKEYSGLYQQRYGKPYRYNNEM